MNIQEAKEEIKKTVRAYTARTAAGTFRIPVPRQRPVLLIGPPGIGKTAIMEHRQGTLKVRPALHYQDREYVRYHLPPELRYQRQLLLTALHNV